jgi:hypothetical protein
VIELTEQQGQEVRKVPDGPVRITDPVTKLEYVIVRAEVYERLSRIMQEVDTSLYEYADLVEE